MIALDSRETMKCSPCPQGGKSVIPYIFKKTYLNRIPWGYLGRTLTEIKRDKRKSPRKMKHQLSLESWFETESWFELEEGKHALGTRRSTCIIMTYFSRENIFQSVLPLFVLSREMSWT